MYESEKQNSSNKDILELEALAFHFTQLSKRLSQDREHWAETGRDLSKVLEQLELTIKELTNFEPKLREQVAIVLQRQSQEAVRKIAQVLQETTQIVLKEQITITANSLNQVVDRASNTLIRYQEDIGSLKKWFLVGIISSALLSSLLIGIGIYCFLPFIEKQEIIKTLEAIEEIESRKQPSSSALPKLPIKNKKNL